MLQENENIDNNTKYILIKTFWFNHAEYQSTELRKNLKDCG